MSLPLGGAMGLIKGSTDVPSVCTLPLVPFLFKTITDTFPIIKTKPAFILPLMTGNITEAFHFTGSLVHVQKIIPRWSGPKKLIQKCLNAKDGITKHRAS